MLDRSKELIDELKTVHFPNLEKSEQQEYIKDHSKRIIYTFNRIIDLKLSEKATVLDLGAKPYLLAYLVKRFSKLNYIGVGYSIKELSGEGAKGAFYERLPVLESELELKNQENIFKFPMWQVNIERDSEPFPDNSMDVIVCTETVEHLVQDPSFLISEIRRILKPGGSLIFSVPNAIYWGRLFKLLAGKNIDDPYSIHGPYGRHNRNYTKKEIKYIFEKAGFQVISLKTKNFTETKISFKKELIRTIGNTIFSILPARKGKTIFGVLKK